MQVTVTEAGNEALLSLIKQNVLETAMHGASFFQKDQNFCFHLENLSTAENLGEESSPCNHEKLEKMDRCSAISSFMKDVRKYPPLSWKEEADLATKAANGNSKARELLILHHMHLVVKIARYYALRWPRMYEDMIQLGNLGLMRGAKKYRLDKQVRFSTYMDWWIRQSIRRGIYATTRQVRIPEGQFKRIRDYDEAVNFLRMKYGRDPDLKEIAAHLQCRLSSVFRILDAISTAYQHAIGTTWDCEDTWLVSEEMIPDTRTSSSEQDIFATLSQATELVISTAKDQTRKKIYGLRSGYTDGVEYTLEEVAEHLDISKSLVQIREKEFLKKLQAVFFKLHDPDRTAPLPKIISLKQAQATAKKQPQKKPKQPAAA